MLQISLKSELLDAELDGWSLQKVKTQHFNTQYFIRVLKLEFYIITYMYQHGER